LSTNLRGTLRNPPELVAFVGRQRTTTIDFCLAVYNGFYAAMDCARKVAVSDWRMRYEASRKHI
jgi:hypothetical protein